MRVLLNKKNIYRRKIRKKKDIYLDIRVKYKVIVNVNIMQKRKSVENY